MPALGIDSRSTLDPHALTRFLERGLEHQRRMQWLLTGHAPLVDARHLQLMVQWSREIAAGAEIAGLPDLAQAAEAVECLAAEAWRSTTPDVIGFSARMGERLRALAAQLESKPRLATG